jgi:putative heme-binding domain-containing protein
MHCINRTVSHTAAILLLYLGAMTSPAKAQVHVGEYAAADVQRGSQLFSTRCTTCHGDAGNQVPGVNLLSGRFRRATSDDELAALIKSGIAGAGMPPGNYSPEELRSLVAYLRSAPAGRSMPGAAAVPIGDVERGRAVFQGKGECRTCHRVNGIGGFRGPNLSEIGAVRSDQSLLESLVAPAAEIVPLNQEIRAITRTGQTIVGRRMNEDTYSVQLIDQQGHLFALMKADLKEFTPLKTSAMPSYERRLSTAELADLVTFLRSLKPVE